VTTVEAAGSTFRPLGFSSVALPPAARELQAEVRAFLAAEQPRDAIGTRVDWYQPSPEFSRKVGARGWIGITWPKEYGGGGRSMLERYVVTEELIAAGAPVAAHWVADRQSGPVLLRYGSEAQRRRFLPGITAGEIYFSIGMSEPDVGSDLASVRTAARKVDGGWVVSGRKTWASRAHVSQFMIALCRTEAAGDRHDGLSQLIVALDSPGIEILPIRYMTGEHYWNDVVFTDVFVPDDMVIGNPGDGWRQVTSELTYERSGPDRFLSVLPLFVALIDKVGTRPDERAAASLGSIYAQLWTLRRLSMSVAAELDRGGSPRTEAALVKDLANCFEGLVVDASRDLVPPSARESGDTFDRLLDDGLLSRPAFTLRGGTSEILRTLVAHGLTSR
jgi:alkylation response protein AidB-like acyl-CoA dehydrogenase